MKAAKTVSLDLGRRVRSRFPLLEDSDVVYLDSAASAQKPDVVLETMDRFYRTTYANIHRGVYQLSEQATERYDQARECVAQFLDAASPREIIFTRGATEGINVVAQSWGSQNLEPGDEIVLSILEHHSNIVPWQRIAAERGASIHYIGLNENGCFDFEEYSSVLTPRTKLVAITQLSNALGIELPVADIISKARAAGARVLVDAAQSVVHHPISVRALDADFLVFSGHKLYGPTGIGVLYGKEALLERMMPYQSGGDMIAEVRIDGTTYNELPMKFEAGTPNIAGAVGLASAIAFVSSLGLGAIRSHEQHIVSLLETALSELDGVTMLGPDGLRVGLVSMVFDRAHSLDVAQLLSSNNIAVRAGHHCAQPLMKYLGYHDTLRASVAMYTSEEDVGSFIDGLRRALRMLQ